MADMPSIVCYTTDSDFIFKMEMRHAFFPQEQFAKIPQFLPHPFTHLHEYLKAYLLPIQVCSRSQQCPLGHSHSHDRNGKNSVYTKAYLESIQCLIWERKSRVAEKPVSAGLAASEAMIWHSE